MPKLRDSETLVGHWLDDGYDVVYTAKAHRENEPLLRRLSVRGFYVLLNWGARQQDSGDTGGLPACSRRGARGGPQADADATASSKGWRADRISATSRRLRAGAAPPHKSTWNVFSLIGLSIEGLTSFSVAPLRVASLLGLLLAFAALIFGTQILIETFVYGQSVPGYP